MNEIASVTSTSSTPLTLQATGHQALRYALVGAINTLIGLTIIWGLMIAGLSPQLANAIGFAIGLCISFLLNRSWTFRHSAASWPVRRYIGSFLLAYGANLAVLELSLPLLGHHPYVAQLPAIVTYSVLFFLLCRKYVFPPVENA